MAPTISLVLCTIGETEKLPRLAHSLSRQTSRDFDIVIVDQSTPGRINPFLQSLPNWLRVTVVRSPRGLSRARNVGLASAHGEIIGMPDDDAWLPAGLIAEIADRFRGNPHLAAISGVTRDDRGELSNGSFHRESMDITKKTVWKAGNSNGIFFRIEAARSIGGFNETLGIGSGTPFGSGEETDFLLRLIAAGYSCRFESNLVVHHDQVDQNVTAATLRRAHLYAAGYGRVLRLHGYSFPFITWRCVRSLVAAAKAAVNGQVNEARRRLIWCRGMMEGYFRRYPEEMLRR
ncbi:glycosyltransferase family 2 protein [Zavarzinia compransoris]|uniref:Glycosyltransferase 2-like domain-containing protein n=1 Tax=Zavarzinia compransoris TaxID=1264899 RepID=A0A317E4H6_9PROT|nr:glycosyltransferase family A protein [Zavarzinia compransoris]PWR21541.1 hypothetical protein DKG75_05910 [Zavarzinia compransoris]TDP45692.1 GT2 family glycosyltransferase [Zavarzinia compransoris]